MTGSLYADTGAGAFLSNGLGARAAGMGHAHVALADDASALYWNPAGLTRLRRSALHTSGASIMGADIRFIGYATPFPGRKESSLAVGYLSTQVNDIWETTAQGTDTGRRFGYEASALLFSAARPLGDFSVGATFKWVQEQLFDAFAQGVGMDIGVLYEWQESLSLGLQWQNMVPVKLYWNTESKQQEIIPSKMIVGLSWALFSGLQVVVDVEMDDSVTRRHLGIEYAVIRNSAISLIGRGGLDESSLSLGIGLSYNELDLDYAYMMPSSKYIDATHWLSVGWEL